MHYSKWHPTLLAHLKPVSKIVYAPEWGRFTKSTNVKNRNRRWCSHRSLYPPKSAAEMRGALRLVPLALLPLLLHPAGALANEICEVDVSPLLSANASHAVRAAAAASLSEAFAKTGFASVVGHGVRTSTIETLRASAVQFFASDAKHAYDKGLGYGHGGYVRNAEAGVHCRTDHSPLPPWEQNVVTG